MAVMTYTRRQVVDMLPEYLTKRGGAVFAAIDEQAKGLGINRLQLVALFNGYLMAQDGVLRAETVRWRSPYALKWTALEGQWQALTDAGLAEAVDGGWRLTANGDAAAVEYQRIFRERLRAASVPQDAASRAAPALARLASRIPPTAERVARFAKRRPRPAAAEPRSALIDLDYAVFELWYFRDDCHVPAWQARGYAGPEFDVLSYVWPGRGDVSFTKLPALTSVDELAKAMAIKQDRADLERNIGALVERGDLAREGDSVRITPQGQRTRDEIEDETDRRFFRVWDLDDAATARLGDDLRAVIDAFPKA